MTAGQRARVRVAFRGAWRRRRAARRRRASGWRFRSGDALADRGAEAAREVPRERDGVPLDDEVDVAHRPAEEEIAHDAAGQVETRAPRSAGASRRGRRPSRRAAAGTAREAAAHGPRLEDVLDRALPRQGLDLARQPGGGGDPHRIGRLERGLELPGPDQADRDGSRARDGSAGAPGAGRGRSRRQRRG